VTISADNTDITVAVTDDGCGYTADSATTGIGLRSSADTLALLGGTLDVRANPDGGTRWRAQIPRQ
jgi:signal transduction histidine kinase